VIAVALTPDSHPWLRVADPRWSDPLDPSFAQVHGGRWNPPRSWPTLHLNRDVPTARAQVVALCAGTPFRPEDLNDDAYDLVTVTLPPRLRVADVVSADGVAAVGFARSYPLDSRGRIVPHRRCRSVGRRAYRSGLDGVECRAAATPDGSGRELAWFCRDRSATTVGVPRPYGTWRS
jgi:hypothetical protein